MKDFDELLEDVLRQQSNGELRHGMEQRILARVRQQEMRRSLWPHVIWLAGTPLAACLIAAIAIHPWRQSAHDTVLSPRVAVTPSPNRTLTEAAPVVSPASAAPRRPHGKRVVVLAHTGEARPKLAQARQEPLPKLDTFPAVTQKSGPLTVSSPAVAQAMQELKTEQERPLVVAAIEIEPL